MSNVKARKVLQVLPELNSGGVERGTVDFARYLVSQGIESIVMSAGGRLVERLEAEGSQHISFPVHRKSLFSLLKVRALRRLLVELNPDIIHVRSRMPAWLIYLALKRWPSVLRPGLVSTFHGLYSINFYSAIMGCGDRVIAISHCVRDYITNNYPKIDADKITVIHRGVDTNQFSACHSINQSWRQPFEKEFPNTIDKALVLMPGRLSPWKGQGVFIDLIECLLAKGIGVHGLIVGEATPGNEDYGKDLKLEVDRRGLNRDISFLGHRSDMENLYKISSVTLNLSQHPEPFGRTVIEALAIGTPVVAYNSGGPAESLRDCLPEGLVAEGDLPGLVEQVAGFIKQHPQIQLPEQFTLDYQAKQTLRVYQQVLINRVVE